MRRVDSEMAVRLNTTMQTLAENANPATYLRIQRHHVPLSEKQFLERTKVRHAAGITDSDVAVCHPHFEKADEDIWVSYIQNGTLHVRYSKNTEILKETSWKDYWFTAPATSCSIAFDSVVKHNARGIWEFITEKEPWVFWVDDGSLKAKLCTPLGEYIYTLALSNVTDVSAVRGSCGDNGNWNLGLTVFFVMNGDLYYRQLIDDVWYDAEQVNNYVVGQLNIAKIKAFNTWDYRVGVQILTTDDKLWELYSYTEGIGTRGTEHISMDVNAVGKLTHIHYGDGMHDEHISMGVSASGVRKYGLSAVPVSAQNVNLEGNYGKVIEVTMDYPNTEGTASEFYLTDSNGVTYSCESVVCSGNVVRLTFIDFNYAYSASSVTVHHTKNQLMSPVVQTNDFTITFTPTGLVRPILDPPEVDSIYNL